MKYRKPHKNDIDWGNLIAAGILVIVAVGAFFFIDYLNTPEHRIITLEPIEHPEKPAPKPVVVPAYPKILRKSTLVPTIATGTATIVDASPHIFAYAHGTAVSGDRFVVGMADRAGNTFPANQLIDFVNPQYMRAYYITLLPHHGDVETLVYDPKSSLDYFLLTENHDLELYSFDPHTLALKSIASTTAIDTGVKPAIVTDGIYVYGITDTVPSTVFKVKLSDGTITSSSKGNISHGHSAAIGIYPGSTELYFGGGMSDTFEKVDATTLAPKGIVDLSPCTATDDMPYQQIDDHSGYIYIGCEIEPYGYRILSSDLTSDRFLLPGSSLGLFTIGPDLYNAAQDGNIDVYPHFDLNQLLRYHVASSTAVDTHNQELELNELFYATSTPGLFFTAWYGTPGMYRIATSS